VHADRHCVQKIGLIVEKMCSLYFSDMMHISLSHTTSLLPITPPLLISDVLQDAGQALFGERRHAVPKGAGEVCDVAPKQH
jgi:hypothetical protein